MMHSYEDAAREAVREMSSGEAELLDVRRDDEWNYMHAEGAIHWDIVHLEEGSTPNIPKDRKIYTYCQAGGRAGRAVTMLKDMGYAEVASIGGLNDWRNAGGDVNE